MARGWIDDMDGEGWEGSEEAFAQRTQDVK
jgi:hypothetical protein